MDEKFTLLPLHLDPSSKQISSLTTTDAVLTTSLSQLNTLHRTLLSLPPDSHQTPPPPLPTNPKRSAQIQKMREQANTLLRKSGPNNAIEAAKLYTYAIEMALSRPGWEPSGLMREETALLYSNRSQAYMGAQMWPEAQADAESSTWLKRSGNAKAWWRRGRCLMEMERVEDARTVLKEAVDCEGEEGEPKTLLKEAEAELKRRERRQ